MTPAEYRERADLILEQRRLKPHEYWDLITQCRVVDSRGQSSPLDDYFLDIVGVPITGQRMLPGWGLPKVKKAEQGRLF
jgi:hypothetical protein